MNITRHLLAALFCAAVSLRAQATFDQGFTTATNGGNAVLANQSLLQTFTVGIAGTLSSVDLKLFAQGTPPLDDLRLYITPKGSNNYVATEPISLSLIPSTQASASYLSISITNAPAMLAGSEWEIWLFSSNVSSLASVDWVRDLTDPYSAGYGGTNNRTPLGSGADHAFRTYMVAGAGGTAASIGTIPLAIPEPADYALWIGALSLVGLLVHRREARKAKNPRGGLVGSRTARVK